MMRRPTTMRRTRAPKRARVAKRGKTTKTRRKMRTERAKTRMKMRVKTRMKTRRKMRTKSEPDGADAYSLPAILHSRLGGPSKIEREIEWMRSESESECNGAKRTSEVVVEVVERKKT